MRRSVTEEKWTRSRGLIMAPLGLKAIVGESKNSVIVVLSFSFDIISVFDLTQLQKLNPRTNT